MMGSASMRLYIEKGLLGTLQYIVTAIKKLFATCCATDLHALWCLCEDKWSLVGRCVH